MHSTIHIMKGGFGVHPLYVSLCSNVPLGSLIEMVLVDVGGHSPILVGPPPLSLSSFQFP